MSETTYSLILGAFPSKDYSVGWLAGSIPAHLIACKLNGKVFWYCPVQFGRGVKGSDREIFKEMIEKILREEIKVGESYKDLKLNEYGYFYDADFSQVLWRFRLERIFQGNHFNEKPEEKKKYEKYFSFREVYLKGKIESDEHWFLISDIQKIVKPIEKVQIEKGKYALPGFKYDDKQLITNHFAYGGAVFSHNIPETCNETILVKAEDEIDSYLKQFFLTKLPDKNLREKVIQQAFAVTLMNKFKNWSLTMEDKLQSGRPDIIFKDENGALVVVEIKRADNDDPITQLKEYVNELRVKYEKIRGLVVCGKKTKELMKKANNQDFNVDVIEYSISINFHKTTANPYPSLPSN